MNSLFSFFNNVNDKVIEILLIIIFIGWANMIFQYIKKKNWFSDKFMNSAVWIGLIVFLATAAGGFFYDLRDEFRESIQYSGGMAFSFIPFFVGAMIGFVLITIFLTYVFRLIVPIFKYIHDKTN